MKTEDRRAAQCEDRRAAQCEDRRQEDSTV